MTKELWIIMAASILLPVAVQLFVILMRAASEKRNGSGIDGAGAAILVGIITVILSYGAMIGYMVLLVLWIVKVIIAGGVNPLLCVIPFFPLVVIVVILIKNYLYRKSFCAEKYVKSVMEKKDRYYRDMPDGSKAISASEYIFCICSEYSSEKYFHHASEEKMREVVEGSLPVLMEDASKERLCKYRAVKGPSGRIYAKIVNWSYDMDEHKVVVSYDDLSTEEFELRY